MHQPRLLGTSGENLDCLFPDLPFDSQLLGLGRQQELRTLALVIQDLQPLLPGHARQPVYQQDTKAALPASTPGVIGVAGKPRAGKDVAADYLEAYYQDVARVNFSDPIILEVNSWLQSSGHVITQSNKSAAIYRSLLQAWGMSRREENGFYWVDSLRKVITRLQDNGTRLVLICGVRALSDLELVEELGGECWLVERPGNTYQAEHAIENALAQIPRDRFRIIENSAEGNLAPYEASIQQAVKAWQ